MYVAKTKVLIRCAPDLRLCFSICKKQVFHDAAHISYNNFCINLQYSDNYYRASLIDSLAATVTPAVTTVTITG